MLYSRPSMKAPADHFFIAHHHRTHGGIRTCKTAAVFGELQSFLHVVGHGGTALYQSNRDATNLSGSNGSRSSIFSPTPMNRIGRFSSRAMATTMPPLAVPSSFVSTMPVTPADSVNFRA